MVNTSLDYSSRYFLLAFAVERREDLSRSAAKPAAKGANSEKKGHGHAKTYSMMSIFWWGRKMYFFPTTRRAKQGSQKWKYVKNEGIDRNSPEEGSFAERGALGAFGPMLRGESRV